MKTAGPANPLPEFPPVSEAELRRDLTHEAQPGSGKGHYLPVQHGG
jgi:hypothetical protein